MKLALDTRRLVNRDNNILQLIAITVLIFIAMSALNPEKFLRFYNFESITYMFPELGLLSIAMMIAMLTGGIDLSVVGIANLSGILAGTFFHAVLTRQQMTTDPALPQVLIGIAIALGTGLVAGALNGLLIARMKITPILATMGTGQLFTGLALVITGGPAIAGFPGNWAFVGNGSLFGLAVPFLIFLAVAVLIAFVLSRTVFGVNLMLIGTNPKAALFAGLRTSRMIFFSYVTTGVLASLAGIILSGRTNAAKADYGTSYLLQAVLIAVLGGTNPAGGRGTVLGVSIAVLALMLLSSGFQMMRFSIHLIDFIWGAFLLLVIAINTYLHRK